LPNAPVTTAMQLDAAGNIYVAGSFVPASKNSISAFVAKLSADGSKLLYFTALAGSQNDAANALALGPDGSAYIAGNTFSSDFPVTAGAFQSTFSGAPQGFLAKVNPSGALVYSTFIGGTASTQITGMALDRGGDVFLTGVGGPAVPATATGVQPFRGFVLELNAGLNTVLLSTYGYGGGLIALDSQDNIYLAGNTQPDFTTGKGLTLPPFQAGASLNAPTRGYDSIMSSASRLATPPDAGRLPGTHLANPIIPLYESPTIRPERLNSHPRLGGFLSKRSARR
jgi:hypothetical protein